MQQIFNSLNIPSRQDNFLTGSEFGKVILNMPPDQKRDDIIIAEILKGNMPTFMRNLSTILISEGNNSIQYNVLPDVLCVGSDDDFLRVSMSGYSYKKIADVFGCSLITKKMSRDIWSAADLKLNPICWGGPFDSVMEVSSTMIWHNEKIEKERNNTNFQLITGHKKDVILSNHYIKGNITIYGWFYSTNGKPIQSIYSKHSENWVDYSDALRLVSQNVIVNGKNKDIFDVLEDKNLCHLISDEGVILNAKKMYIT